MPNLSEVLAHAATQCGFLSKSDVAVIAAEDRLRGLLVRCGGCRFICGAQYVEHLTRCVEAGGDYIRDISLPAGDPALKKDEARHPLHALPPTPAPSERPWIPEFRESDCGGVFDGHNVTSDADPGL